MNTGCVKKPRSPLEILVAEDSFTQAEQLRHMLEEHGYRLATARNGGEALAALEQRTPTLVISDIVMPEMDGYELCRRIKQDEKLRDIPVILLTSLSDPTDVMRGLESGADSFIFKPYDQQYLLARISYILANRHLREKESAQMGLEIFFAGRKFFITSDRLQILNLLLSTYEAAVQKNRQLTETQDGLRMLNEHLETKVRERTAALEAEIVERQRAEEQTRKLNEELEKRVHDRTAQLEAVNKELEAFSYSVSHDLRAPVRHIDGFVNLFNKFAEAELSDKSRHYLNLISGSAKQMGRLIDDLLNFSRMGREELRRSAVKLDALVEETIQRLQPEFSGRNIVWKKGVCLRCKVIPRCCDRC